MPQRKQGVEAERKRAAEVAKSPVVGPTRGGRVEEGPARAAVAGGGAAARGTAAWGSQGRAREQEARRRRGRKEGIRHGRLDVAGGFGLGRHASRQQQAAAGR